MKDTFFPPRPQTNPTIYAYELIGVESHKGWLKVGFTDRDANKRIKEQVGTAAIEYRIVLEESALRQDGSSFSDHDVHRELRSMKITNPEGEWFACDLDTVKKALHKVRTGLDADGNRTLNFKMRPEQEEAVKKTITYFTDFQKSSKDKKTPHFLWNAKMRFGKTFTTYQLAKKMGWKKILIMTFKPAVESAWETDLKTHMDFKGWEFRSRKTIQSEDLKATNPIVCFGSFQDFLGRDKKTGGIKPRNEWVHTTNWDCVIFDEYHFGAWRDKSKDLFGMDLDVETEEKLQEELQREGLQEEDTASYMEEILPITSAHYLYLSGTPFRAISSGEFIEEQIFNWTYSDEQKAKEAWDGENNPYVSLPRMVMLTYQLPDSIRQIAMQGEFNEFDLNTFFSAEGIGEDAKFKYEEEVQKWLDMIRGSYLETSIDNLKLGAKKPPLPFSDIRLLNILSHTFWFLPSVASCHAMANLIKQPQNTFYQDYNVIVAAGSKAGMGLDALAPVETAMEINHKTKTIAGPLKTKTITLSCGKLTTGVTVKPWGGILMLRNTSTPETYFQSAFRVQSPWTILNPDDHSPNKELIMKEECYVFDFAPDRALRQIAEYSNRLNIDIDSTEKRVEEFIKFLPVLAYDGSTMKRIDAATILDIATSGTSATLLAKRWESALLVNVDDMTLQRLLDNKDILDGLMKIEGFRNLNKDLETIINVSDKVKKVTKEETGKDTPQKDPELDEEKKKMKSLRKQVQEKLIKFATRIPIFMYLTDYREESLKDVITALEPGLFKRVTNLDVKDFDQLVGLGVFNESLMNDAVFKFRRYEEASLEYTGVNRHKGGGIGLFDTKLSPKDYEILCEVK